MVICYSCIENRREIDSESFCLVDLYLLNGYFVLSDILVYLGKYGCVGK